MFAPTKTWRRWHRKVNINQKRFAVVSALAASALPALLMARGHRVDNVAEVPLVVDDAAESITKTKAALELLAKLGAMDDVEKARTSKNLRRGKGKMRNRRYVSRRGPLVVYAGGPEVPRAFRNIPGVECAHVDRLNLLQLAPGGHLGRFCIWTKSAFARLDEVFGTTDKESTMKKGYKLPRNIMTNPDLARLINSDEIQSIVAPPKEGSKPATLKRNPLKSLETMVSLNPAAKEARLAALRESSKEEGAKRRQEKLKAARANREAVKKVSRAFYNTMVTDAEYVGEDYDVFSSWLGSTQ